MSRIAPQSPNFRPRNTLPRVTKFVKFATPCLRNDGHAPLRTLPVTVNICESSPRRESMRATTTFPRRNFTKMVAVPMKLRKLSSLP